MSKHYKLVKPPDNYPGKRYINGRYAYEHHVVWWKAKGTLVPSGFILHHKNEDKRDNRIENLELKSRRQHGLEHMAPLKLAATMTLECAFCKRRFSKKKKVFRWVLSQRPDARFYCGRVCVGKAFGRGRPRY